MGTMLKIGRKDEDGSCDTVGEEHFGYNCGKLWMESRNMKDTEDDV